VTSEAVDHISNQRLATWIKNDQSVVAGSTRRHDMKKARVCKYPGCYYYHKDATRYCCDACRHDHYDYDHMKKNNEGV